MCRVLLLCGVGGARTATCPILPQPAVLPCLPLHTNAHPLIQRTVEPDSQSMAHSSSPIFLAVGGRHMHAACPGLLRHNVQWVSRKKAEMRPRPSNWLFIPFPCPSICKFQREILACLSQCGHALFEHLPGHLTILSPILSFFLLNDRIDRATLKLPILQVAGCTNSGRTTGPPGS